MKQKGQAFLFGNHNLSGSYFGAAGALDWTSPQNNDLWQDLDKTLFDPCPSDWRVPRSGTGSLSPWAAFTTVNGPYSGYGPTTGRSFGLSVSHNRAAWYPAAGYREASRHYYPDGRLYGVTMYCHSRTSTVKDADVYIFHYNTSSAFPFHTYSRPSGIPVRCIRE